MWGSIAVRSNFSPFCVRKEPYNINETDAADVKAIHTTDCKAVCHACTPIVPDKDNWYIPYR